MKLNDEKLEIIVAIALGIVALLTAWTSWIGSLHGGNQATNYALSNNLSSEANSTWNEASQQFLNDLQTWSRVNDLLIEIQFAEDKGDTEGVEKYQWKLDQIMNDGTSEEFEEAINWALEQEEYATPFEKEGFVDSYYASAIDLFAQSEEVLKQGQQDNTNGDRLGLVTVFYSVVLFLLGIVGTFKNTRNKTIVISVAVVCSIIATILMVIVPLPTGFSLMSFFK